MQKEIEQALENLSDTERQVALSILQQLSKDGSSPIYNKLILEDYEEIPVDIETFLYDKEYLGSGLVDQEGRKTVFPYWVKVLKQLFPDPLAPPAYRTLALSGAIGIGKSFEAVLVGLYELYRMMCLKDPYLHYGLQPIDKITFAFMNITLDAAKGVAWDKCQQLLQSSPWFMKRGTLSKSNYPIWSPPKGIELICGSQSRHIIGRAVFFCFFDEISFQLNQDVEKQKAKASKLVNTASTRMQSRFMKGEKNPTILVVASSKRTEQSYMESFIEGKKKSENKTTLIIDEPQWVIRTDKDSKNKFKVAIGNKFLSSEIVPLNHTEKDLEIYRNRGYTLLDVPMGYYESFTEDIEVALTDIAGISTSNSNRYISGPRIVAIKDSNYQNAFTRDIIEIGNAKEDTAQYSDYFDLSRIDSTLKSKPLFIHMDMSISGDKTGIAGVFVVGKKPPQPNMPESRDLIFKLGFSTSIKAPKGYQISFEKNRQFIYWLSANGFNIKGISTDSYQSADSGQALSAKGYNYNIISVDIVDRESHICKPYQYLRSVMYEERLSMYSKCDLLTDELIGLERDNNSGKIDHSAAGINCFSGDTEVLLADGRTLSFFNLLAEYKAGKTNYIYSMDLLAKKVLIKPIKKVWCSGHNAKLLEITLNNRVKIKCTPEHRFMLTDGTYCEAQHLKVSDKLMPLHSAFIINDNTCALYYYNIFTNSWENILNSNDITPFNASIIDEYHIIDIKDYDQLQDVFDLEVDGTHNFALACGIFVHNSKDQADALCGAVWNASQYASQYAFDYGETIPTIIDVNNQSTKSIDINTFNNQFEQELTGIFDNNKENIDVFTDFGMGKASDNFTMQYLNRGIIIW